MPAGPHAAHGPSVASGPRLEQPGSVLGGLALPSLPSHLQISTGATRQHHLRQARSLALRKLELGVWGVGSGGFAICAWQLCCGLQAAADWPWTGVSTSRWTLWGAAGRPGPAAGSPELSTAPLLGQPEAGDAGLSSAVSGPAKDPCSSAHCAAKSCCAGDATWGAPAAGVHGRAQPVPAAADDAGLPGQGAPGLVSVGGGACWFWGVFCLRIQDVGGCFV